MKFHREQVMDASTPQVHAKDNLGAWTPSDLIKSRSRYGCPETIEARTRRLVPADIDPRQIFATSAENTACRMSGLPVFSGRAATMIENTVRPGMAATSYVLHLADASLQILTQLRTQLGMLEGTDTRNDVDTVTIFLVMRERLSTLLPLLLKRYTELHKDSSRSPRRGRRLKP